MARKKRNRSKRRDRTLAAIDAVIERAKSYGLVDESAPPRSSRNELFRAPLPRGSRRLAAKNAALRGPGMQVILTRHPRQLALTDPRRNATIRAMEEAAGKPIGRKTRDKLRGLIPDVVHETLCKRKRKRREVMFAAGAAGKGKRDAASRPRQMLMGKC